MVELFKQVQKRALILTTIFALILVFKGLHREMQRPMLETGLMAVGILVIFHCAAVVYYMYIENRDNGPRD